MVKVRLYSRKECHLCEQAVADLNDLAREIPHQLEIIDVDANAGDRHAYGDQVPVVLIGPYQLKAPFHRQDLKIALQAAQHGEEQNRAIDQAIAQGKYPGLVTWNGADRFAYWLSKHYLGLLNLIVLTYVSLPFLAPVLMKTGATGPAYVLYRVYGSMCHQMAFRSWFLFGEQPAYPRAAAGVSGLLSYEQATGLSGQDIWQARQFLGNEVIGYKVALCQRDIAIYLAILGFGLLFILTGRKLRSIHWTVWILLALVPIGLDGLSQFLSQPPFNLLPYRESTPLLRTLTGALFGFSTAWFGYPMVEESMADTRKYMEGKLARFKNLVRNA